MKYSFIFLLMVLMSCGSKRQDLVKVWFYESSDFPSEEELGEKIGYNSMEHTINLHGHSFIDLQEDGSYSCDFGGYDYGKWYFKDGKLKLVNQKRQVLELEVKGFDDEGVKLLHRSRGALYTFSGYKNEFKEAEDNPFSPVNNAWRIEAQREEGSLGVSKRIRNYFRYWEKYFAWGLAVERTSLDVRSLPGPLKMYSNGFTLIPYDEQPRLWHEQFYNESERRMAYNKLDSFFRYSDINWKNTDNRFEMFRDAFHQAADLLPAGYTE